MKNSERKVYTRILFALIPAALFILWPHAVLFFASDIAGFINAEAKEVLSAWKTADIKIPVFIPLLSAAVWYMSAVIYGRMKIMSKRTETVFIVAGALYVAAGFIVTLFLTKVNSVPVYIVLKVVLRLL